jgi:serine/threonine protein phosphatase PrpC
MLYVIEDIGMRNYQEDRHSIAFNIHDDLHYFAVFDGHGDEKVAVFMKLYFKDILKSELAQTNKFTIEKCMLNAFKRLQTVLPKNISTYAGTTALVILKSSDTLYIANVGDSRAILNFRDKVIPVTEDHKPNTKSEYERITDLGGAVVQDSYGTHRVNGSLALSRAIGDYYLSPFVSWVPDIYTVKLNQHNSFVVAASDGLWDVFDNQEVVDFIYDKMNGDGLRSNPKRTLNTICTSLLQRARIKGSGDNITILLLVL